MKNDNFKIKLFNILYTVLMFIPLFISFLLINGSLYKNGWSYFLAIVIILLVIACSMLINYYLAKKYFSVNKNFEKKLFFWVLLPLIVCFIFIISIV